MFIRSIALFGALSLLVAASPASLIDENHLIERGKGPKNKSVTLFGPNGTLIVPGQGMYPDKKHNMPGGDWGFNLYPGGPPMHPTKLKFASWDFWYWKENGPETQDFTYYVYNLTELNIEADRWPVEGDGMGQFSRVRGKDPADAFNTANASATFECKFKVPASITSQWSMTLSTADPWIEHISSPGDEEHPPYSGYSTVPPIICSTPSVFPPDNLNGTSDEPKGTTRTTSIL